MNGRICVRCGESGADRQPEPGLWLHSGCLVVLLIMVEEFGGTVGDILLYLSYVRAVERWIPE